MWRYLIYLILLGGTLASAGPAVPFMCTTYQGDVVELPSMSNPTPVGVTATSGCEVSSGFVIYVDTMSDVADGSGTTSLQLSFYDVGVVGRGIWVTLETMTSSSLLPLVLAVVNSRFDFSLLNDVNGVVITSPLLPGSSVLISNCSFVGNVTYSSPSSQYISHVYFGGDVSESTIVVRNNTFTQNTTSHITPNATVSATVGLVLFGWANVSKSHVIVIGNTGMCADDMDAPTSCAMMMCVSASIGNGTRLSIGADPRASEAPNSTVSDVLLNTTAWYLPQWLTNILATNDPSPLGNTLLANVSGGSTTTTASLLYLTEVNFTVISSTSSWLTIVGNKVVADICGKGSAVEVALWVHNQGVIQIGNVDTAGGASIPDEVPFVAIIDNSVSAALTNVSSGSVSAMLRRGTLEVGMGAVVLVRNTITHTGINSTNVAVTHLDGDLVLMRSVRYHPGGHHTSPSTVVGLGCRRTGIDSYDIPYCTSCPYYRPVGGVVVLMDNHVETNTRGNLSVLIVTGKVNATSPTIQRLPTCAAVSPFDYDLLTHEGYDSTTADHWHTPPVFAPLQLIRNKVIREEYRSDSEPTRSWTSVVDISEVHASGGQGIWASNNSVSDHNGVGTASTLVVLGATVEGGVLLLTSNNVSGTAPTSRNFVTSTNPVALTFACCNQVFDVATSAPTVSCSANLTALGAMYGTVVPMERCVLMYLPPLATPTQSWTLTMSATTNLSTTSSPRVSSTLTKLRNDSTTMTLSVSPNVSTTPSPSNTGNLSSASSPTLTSNLTSTMTLSHSAANNSTTATLTPTPTISTNGSITATLSMSVDTTLSIGRTSHTEERTLTKCAEVARMVSGLCALLTTTNMSQGVVSTCVDGRGVPGGSAYGAGLTFVVPNSVWVSSGAIVAYFTVSKTLPFLIGGDGFDIPLSEGISATMRPAGVVEGRYEVVLTVTISDSQDHILHGATHWIGIPSSALPCPIGLAGLVGGGFEVPSQFGVRVVFEGSPPLLSQAVMNVIEGVAITASVLASPVAIDVQLSAALQMMDCAPAGRMATSIRALSAVALSDTCEGLVVGNILVLVLLLLSCALVASVYMCIKNKSIIRANIQRAAAEKVPKLNWIESAGAVRCPSIVFTVALFMQSGMAVCGVQLLQVDGFGVLGGVGIGIGIGYPIVAVLLTETLVARRCLEVVPARWWLWVNPNSYHRMASIRPATTPFSFPLMMCKVFLTRTELDNRVSISRAFASLVANHRLQPSVWAAFPPSIPLLIALLALASGDQCVPLYGVVAALYVVGAMVYFVFTPHRLLAFNWFAGVALLINAALVVLASLVSKRVGGEGVTEGITILSILQVALTLVRVVHYVCAGPLRVLLTYMGKASPTPVGAVLWEVDGRVVPIGVRRRNTQFPDMEMGAMEVLLNDIGGQQDEDDIELKTAQPESDREDEPMPTNKNISDGTLDQNALSLQPRAAPPESTPPPLPPIELTSSDEEERSSSPTTYPRNLLLSEEEQDMLDQLSNIRRHVQTTWGSPSRRPSPKRSSHPHPSYPSSPHTQR